MAVRKTRARELITDAAIAFPKSGQASTVSLSALKEQAAGLRRAQLMANLAHVITKPDGSFESWSENLPALIGVKEDQIVTSTRRWLDLVHPGDRGLFRETALAARAAGRRAELEYRLCRSDGVWIHVRQVMEPIPGEADGEGRKRWFNTLQDVTEQKLAAEKIKRLNRVYAVLSGINSLIVRVRNRADLFKEACDIAIKHGGFRMAWLGLADGGFTCVKPVASAGDVGDFFGSAPLSLLESDRAFGFVGRVMLDRKPAVSLDIQRDRRKLMKQECAARGINSLAVIPLTLNAKAIGVFALYAADAGFFDDEEMRLLLELAGDVSFALEYIDKSEKAEYFAYYDPLTTLANRSLFHERLAQHLAVGPESQHKLALMMVDIERFKTINDSLGRQAGDELLKSIAVRITALIPHVRVARIGSDQFAIVVPDVESAEDLARDVETHLKDFFGMPYRLGESDLRISGRLGIALYPEDGPDAETLFRNAEAALKKSKLAGESYLFYEERMSERVSEKLALENKLRQAIEKEEFVLHYQPKVDLETRTVTGVEALLRWQNAELGLVPPLKFIHLLEETGLILQVGSWALRRAALDHQTWTKQGLQAPRVAVNVSAIQLRQRNFVRLVEDAIVDGVAPTGIDLEITESLLMEDIQATIEKLQSVRGLGISLAIDDFGTGYSSLAYLAKLPVQALKIDRCFIVAMHDDPNAMTIVSTIISLAHSLHLKVVAEGVETEEQAKILRLLRCDEMQGYLFCKPIPVNQLVALLAKKR
jgi:diguanylate cyclase (GGDEF)-like protein/PAS domain S-box-containing protein